MTNIDISKLTGDWKTWALDADAATDTSDPERKTKGDNWINSAFEEDFVYNKAKTAGKSDEEINEIFGAEFSNKQTKNAVVSNTTTTPSENVKAAMERAAISNLAQTYSDAVILADNEGVSWNDMVDIAEEQAKKLKQENKLVDANYYESLIEPMRSVANAMKNKTFNSREEIMKLYTEVKKELKSDKNDALKDFKLNVLKQFILIAENFQKNKETKAVTNEYNELRKKYSREESMDIIQNDPKFKDSYYHDYYHDAAEKANLTDREVLRKRSGIIHKFEDTVVMDEARKEAWAAMDEQKGKTELTTYKQVRKAAKQALGDKLDKYTKKVFRGEMSLADRLKFEKSTTKVKGQSVGSENNETVQTNKEYTFEYLSSKFKDDANVQSFLQSGLITQNENGTYNIKPLAEKIKNRIGADLTANRQKKDLYPYSEVENTINQIASDSGVRLSEKEVKNLIKLCGFKTEGKNWVKIILDSAVETLIPVAGMTAGTLLNKGNVKGIQDVELPYVATANLETLINQNLNVDLNLKLPNGVTVDGRQLYKDLLKQGINADNIKMTYDNGKLVGVSFNMSDSLKGDTTEIKIHGTTKDKVPTEIKADKKLLDVLFKQIGLVYGLALLKNAFMDNQGELPVAVTQFGTKDINEYKRLIDVQQNLNRTQKETLKNLAEQFVTKQNWNVEEYKDTLNKIAGDSSFLNKNELAIGADGLINNAKQVVTNNNTTNTTANTQATNTVQAPAETQKEISKVDAKEEYKDKQITANYNKGNKHTWPGLVALYADCRKNNPNLKYIDIVHAIKDKNGIKYTDNVIPPDLYLPEQLFSENEGKIKTFENDKAREMFIYSHDKAKKITKKVKSNGTKLGVTRVSNGYRGIKYWYDSNGKEIASKTTTNTYPNAEAAKQAAKELKQ